MRLSKRTLVLLGVIVVAIAASVGAYAYWTATGSGNGTATVGTSTNQLYVVGTTSGGSLTPGGPSRTVNFHGYNYSTNAESISKIHLASVRACKGGVWTLPTTGSYPAAVLDTACTGGGGTVALQTASATGCGTVADNTNSNATTRDFYLADVTVDPSVDGNFAATSNHVMTSFGTITMNNRLDTSLGAGDGNQETCKNADLLLVFTTS